MNFSQIKDITIPEGTVTQITANSAVLWKKNTSPWSDEFTVGWTRRGGSIVYNTGLSTPPEKVVYKLINPSNNFTQVPSLRGNNYFITERSTNLVKNVNNIWTIYPIWTLSNNVYTCNMYTGSTSGYSETLQFVPSTGVLTLKWTTSITTSGGVSCNCQVAINRDPIQEEFTQILNANWNWDVNNNSGWGSNPTAFQNFTLPVTYTRIQFNAIVPSGLTATTFTLSSRISGEYIYNITLANLNKYVFEFGTGWMTQSNTTTPLSRYFDIYGSGWQVQFFPTEYVNNTPANRFAWMRKLVNNTVTLNLQFNTYVKQ